MIIRSGLAAVRALSVMLLVSLGIVLNVQAVGATQVAFVPNTLQVVSDSTFDTPHIVIQNATGVTMVTLDIFLPAGITIDANPSGTGIVSVVKGVDAGNLFFAEWNASERKISVACDVIPGETLELIKSIRFNTLTATNSQITMNGTITGGSDQVSFGPLTLLLAHTLQINSNPCSGVSIAFSPATGKPNQSSPQPTPCTLSYQSSAGSVQLTAPVKDSSVPQRWFDHWILDSTNQTAGSRTLVVDVTSANRSATAVYSGLVGDLNTDGNVDDTDADIALQALFGDISQTQKMDINQDGQLKLDDVRWIVEHKHVQ